MANIKLSKRKAGKIAYIAHTGSYKDVPYDEIYSKLYGWAKENKAKPGFKALGIFMDDPEKVPTEKCRSEIGIPIYGSGPETEEIKLKTLPEMDVAVMKFKGESDDYIKAYHEIAEWIKANGYDWAGPCIEEYTKKPKVKGGKTIMFANIQVPVIKK
jgi:AraC family transcriptional regulator